MADFGYEVNDWAAGVVQSLEGDKLPSGALMHARNTHFRHVGLGGASIGTRPGLRLATQFVTFGGPAPGSNYKHLVAYNYPASASVAHTPYMAAIDSFGVLRYKEPDDSWDATTLQPPGSYPSPGTCIPPEFVNEISSTVMNGRLFFVAGTIRRSLLGKTYQPFGLEPIVGTVNTTINVALTNELPADTYDVYITAYNTPTGTESSPTFLGTVTTNGALNRHISVTLASTLVSDTWRVYVQRTSTQSQPYLLTTSYTSGGLTATSTGNIPAATTVVFVNASAEVLADLITPMPTFTENLPLSNEAVMITTFGRRMLAASRRKLFWSKLDLPESWPATNFEVVDTGAGDEIVALVPAGDELCLVLTKNATFGLFGLDPQYWTLKPIDLTLGCVGHKSVVRFDNKVAWWSSQYGPVIFDGQRIQKIGHELLGHEQGDQATGFVTSEILAGWDPYYEHIVWTIPDVGDVFPTRMLPYNYRLNRFVASTWDPFIVNCMATGKDSSGNDRLFIMDDVYSLYYFDDRTPYDGAPGGTLSGTFNPGSNFEITTIAGTGFYSQALGANTITLAGQRVTITDSAGNLIARPRISINTSTQLTLDRIVTLPVASVDYNFYISTPYVEIVTGWLDAGQPFLRKRHDRLYMDFKIEDASIPVHINLYINNNHMDIVSSFELLANAGQQVDAPPFGTNPTLDVPWTTTMPFTKVRSGLWFNAHNMQIKVHQHQPTPWYLTRLAVLGRMLSDRYYA